jgi:23S rRNA (cytidine1920-2'-O)/16S rRNA (cytidine1409-2'-O)-methyltransferase
MRLDVALVEAGLAPSRASAKRAIAAGLVLVDGAVARKPAQRVPPGARLEVAAEATLPCGFSKLAAIDAAAGLLRPADVVLDLGSSAGGFLLYCAGRCGRAFGVEVAEGFRSELEAVAARCRNVSVLFADAFTMEPSSAVDGRLVTVLLNDLTVEPEASLAVTARFLPLLAPGGRLLQVLKLGGRGAGGVESLARSALEGLGVAVELVLPGEGRELYLVCRKRP